MTTVNEWVVREYFESLGYFVNQPRKYVSPGKQKQPEEEVDLLIVNPRATEHKVPESMVWTADDLRTVARAVVGIRGWHTERFSVLTFEQTPEILRFAKAESVSFAQRLLGSDSVAKILCLPRLPASGELKQKSIQALRDRGIDGVISFPTMLSELVARVDINRNYEKSDLLQMLRIMKNYDLLSENQMDLFVKRRHRPRGKRASPKEQQSE